MLLWTAAVSAEPVTWVRSFRSFDRRTTGLPQSTPLALLQEESGLLWIATLDGVATFDGTLIERLAPSTDAPSHGAVYSLARRRNGGLYAGGTRGVHVFDGSRWKLLPTESSVYSIAEDGAGAIWVVDSQGKVWRNERPDSSRQWEAMSGPRIPDPAVAVSSGGTTVWIGGATGVSRAFGGKIASDGDSPRNVSALLAVDSGECWVGTGDGKLYARNRSGSWVAAPLSGWTGGRIR